MIGFAIALSLLLAMPVYAQQTDDVGEVLAYVGDVSISRGQVIRLLGESTRQLPIARELRQLGEAPEFNSKQIDAALQQCIDREIVLQHLQSGDFKTGPGEIGLQLESFRNRLKEIEETLEDSLAKAGISESEFQREIQWQNSWRKFVRSQITESSLRAAFETNRQQYDGTRRRVAQILWKSSDEKTLALASKVRKDLVDGKLSWTKAVADNSQAASAKNDGDLAWIGFDGPMSRQFTDVAFGLEKGDFSKPFVSQFGLHIVRCKDIQRGEKTFDDVVEKIRLDQTKLLFQTTAAKYRKQSDVKLERPDAK